jgi:bifunctional UDP-N-acetylglucosamine pyrophosphorylase/glucosamine-1-phosphate N-acetyltransferase
MKSGLPKVLHRLAGRPMIRYVVDTALACGAERVVMVVGHGAEMVRAAVDGLPVEFVTQEQQLGTGHAVMSARDLVECGPPRLLILSGDVPLLEPQTVARLADRQAATGAGCTMLTTSLDDPSGYGRVIIGDTGQVERIVEQADADDKQLLLRLINAGIYCFRTDLLFRTLAACGSDNAQGEYYLTDAIEAIRGEGLDVHALEVADPDQVAGINTRLELSRMDAVLNRRKLEALMLAGVTVVSPDTTRAEWDVDAGRDTVLHPHVSLEGRTRLGVGCTIHSFCRLKDTVVGDGATVLEYCRLDGSSLAPGSETGPNAVY